MSKIDFNKVEQVLEEGLRQFGVKQLLYLADLAATFGMETTGKESAFDDQETKSLTLHTLFRNLQILRKKDKDLYKKLGINTKKMKNLVDNPAQLTSEEWEKIKKIRQRLDEYRRELRRKLEQISDQDIIKSERKKHINKRFNINEKWLPLH